MLTNSKILVVIYPIMFYSQFLYCSSVNVEAREVLENFIFYVI
jgi:hypothetical protein